MCIHINTGFFCGCTGLCCRRKGLFAYDNTAQQTAPHCTTLQHTATHCNTTRPTLQHTALQHTTIHCNTTTHTLRTAIHSRRHRFQDCTGSAPFNCNTQQHTATFCNTLQYSGTHCSTLQHNATHCNTLQHTAAHLNTLQHFRRCRASAPSVS